MDETITDSSQAAPQQNPQEQPQDNFSIDLTPNEDTTIVNSDISQTVQAEDNPNTTLEDNTSGFVGIDSTGNVSDKNYTPDEIYAMAERGEISVEDAEKYILQYKIDKDGIFSLDAKQSIKAYEKGLIEEAQLKDISEEAAHPVWFRVKENLEGVLKGVGDIALDVGKTAIVVGNALPSVNDLIYSEEENKAFEEKTLKVLNSWKPKESSLTSANITRDVTEVLGTFIPVFRATKVVSAATEASKASEFFRATAAGGITDFTITNEGEDRLSNFIQQYPELQNPVTEFLQSTKDESALEAKLKGTLEGLGIGLAADGLIASFKALKYVKSTSNDVMGRPEDFIKSMDEKVSVSKQEAKPQDDLTPTKDAKKQDEPLEDATPNPLEDADAKVVDVAKQILDPEADVVIPEEVGFRMSSVHDSSEAWDLIGKIEQGFKDEMNAARGGEHKSFEITKEDASKFGADYDKVKELWGATQDLEAKFLATKSYLEITGRQLAKEADELSAKIAKGEDNEKDLYEFYDKVKFYGNLQGMVRGIQTNAARTVAAGRIRVGKGFYEINNETLDELSTAIANAGGKEELRKFAKEFKELGSEEARNQYARDITKVSLHDMVSQYWVNQLLSGIGTQAVNIIGGGLALTTRVLEHSIAVTGRTLVERDLRHLNEGVMMFKGMALGLKDGLKASLKAFKENAPQLDAMTKLENDGNLQFPSLMNETPFKQRIQQIIEGSVKEGKSKPLEAAEIMSKIIYHASGDVLTLPLRFLTATDEIFKNIAYRSEVYRSVGERANIIEDAAKRATFIENAVKSPPKDIHLHAISKARELTFTEEFRGKNMFHKGKDIAPTSTAVDTLLSHVQGAKNAFPPLMYVMPFIRTPMNIVKFSARRTPLLNTLSKRFREDLAAGGTRAYEAIARNLTGIGAMYIGYSLWESGDLIGRYPKGMKEAMRGAGIPEYSIRIGDKFVQYNRLDPLGLFLGITADVSQTIEDYNNSDEDDDDKLKTMVADLILAAGNNITNKTYMKGLNDLIKIQTDPERYSLETYGKNLASTFMPYGSLQRQLNAEEDEYYRERDELRDYFDNITDPSKLPPMLDALGEPVKRQPKALMSIQTSKLSDDYVKQQMLYYGVSERPQGKRIQVFGGEIELDKRQLNELRAMVKKAKLRETLEATFRGLEGKIEDKATVQKIIKGIFSSARKTALQLYLAKHPEIRDELIAQRIERAKAIKERNNTLNYKYESTPLQKDLNKQIEKEFSK